MPRRYEVVGEGITLTAASDLIQIKGASGKMVQVIRWWWKPYDNSLPTAQVLATRCRFLPATVTDGSGGSSATPRPLDPGDAAATFTALVNNTTKASTSGTAATLDESGAHIYNGYEQQPEEPIIVPASTSFVFELISASIQGTIKAQVGVEVEEMG